MKKKKNNDTIFEWKKIETMVQEILQKKIMIYLHLILLGKINIIKLFKILLIFIYFFSFYFLYLFSFSFVFFFIYIFSENQT